MIAAADDTTLQVVAQAWSKEAPMTAMTTTSHHKLAAVRAAAAAAAAMAALVAAQPEPASKAVALVGKRLEDEQTEMQKTWPNIHGRR